MSDKRVGIGSDKVEEMADVTGLGDNGCFAIFTITMQDVCGQVLTTVEHWDDLDAPEHQQAYAANMGENVAKLVRALTGGEGEYPS